MVVAVWPILVVLGAGFWAKSVVVAGEFVVALYLVCDCCWIFCWHFTVREARVVVCPFQLDGCIMIVVANRWGIWRGWCGVVVVRCRFVGPLFIRCRWRRLVCGGADGGAVWRTVATGKSRVARFFMHWVFFLSFFVCSIHWTGNSGRVGLDEFGGPSWDYCMWLLYREWKKKKTHKKKFERSWPGLIRMGHHSVKKKRRPSLCAKINVVCGGVIKITWSHCV